MLGRFHTASALSESGAMAALIELKLSAPPVSGPAWSL
jgi:hypothetical protein